MEANSATADKIRKEEISAEDVENELKRRGNQLFESTYLH